MEANSSLVEVRRVELFEEQTTAHRFLVPSQTFNSFQGKGSIHTTVCTDECLSARVCYMRSGSSSIAMQNCQQGFGSVQ